MRQVDQIASEVAGASREQSQGISQINTAVSQMDKVTQSNAANAEESAAAAEELNAQAQSMKDAVVDLLQLVDGQTAKNKSSSIDRPLPSRAAHTVKSGSPIQGNRHNGHSAKARAGVSKPTLITSNRRADTEGEDGFTEM